MSGTPPNDNQRDPDRDAWLRAALRHAPDAEDGAPPAISQAILRRAQAQAQAPAAGDPRSAARPRRGAAQAASGQQQGGGFWAWLVRPQVAGALASLAVATLAGVLWWGQPMDDAVRGHGPDERMREHDRPASPAAVPGSPSSDLAAAASAAVSASASASAPAPAPAPAPVAKTEVAAEPVTATSAAAPATALPATAAAAKQDAKPADPVGEMPPSQKMLPRTMPSPSSDALAKESARSMSNPPLAEARAIGAAAAPPAPPAPAAAAPPAASPAIAPAITPADTPAMAPALAGGASPPIRPAAPATTAEAPGLGTSLAGARIQRDEAAPSPVAETEAPTSLALQAARKARAADDANLPDNPVARLRAAMAAWPEVWTWQRDGGPEQALGDAQLAWLRQLEAAAGARWQTVAASAGGASTAAAPGATATTGTTATLRLMRNGQPHSTVRLQAAGASIEGESAATAQRGGARRVALSPAAAASLKSALNQATR
jgi:hypothetical protein